MNETFDTKNQEHSRPKKSLGQNFLTSEAAVHKIVTAANIAPGETVLEVGPGRGVLTAALLAAGAHVVAVEKDRELIAPLSERFAAEIATSQFSIIEGDALEIDVALFKSYKIVANLPYYITGQFLKKFLSETSAERQPTTMVLLLQKEVVDRIIANDKKESLLSVSIKVYGEPHKVTVVKSGSFFPAPNVDSAVIAIEHISKTYFDTISEVAFFEILRAGFAHKRKVLISNLAELFDRVKVAAVFGELSISEKIRAEDMTLEQWKEVVKKLSV